MTVLWTGAGKSVDRSWLVMVFKVKSIPSSVVVHEGLPSLCYVFEFCELENCGRKFAAKSMINVDTVTAVRNLTML
jgi:hypothetical protein